MALVTVHIAEAGALTTGEPSTAGHMWITTEDGNSYGFAPIIDPNAPAAQAFAGPGWVVPDDNSHYLETYYERTFTLTDAQYAGLLDFVEHPENNGFVLYYQATVNSCVDFVWGALDAAGFDTDVFSHPLDVDGYGVWGAMEQLTDLRIC